MPVATRASCTQIGDVDQDWKVTLNGPGQISIILADFNIGFQSCQGVNNQNNDLAAHYEKLANENKVESRSLEWLQTRLVGSGGCDGPTVNFLKEKGWSEDQIRETLGYTSCLNSSGQVLSFHIL